MTEPHPAQHDRVIKAGTRLHRIHSTRQGSLAYFDTTSDGRFNLTDVAGRGTCYLAFDPLGAYVETLGRILTRPRSDVHRRRHSVVTVGRDLNLFDLTQSASRNAYQAEGLDLTATIGAGDSYTNPQRLARLIHDDHFDGIVFTARHDPGHTLSCIALFGPSGPNDTERVFDTCKTAEISDELIEAGRTTFGIEILPEPTL